MLKKIFLAAAVSLSLVGCATQGYVGDSYGYGSYGYVQRTGTVSHITYIPPGGTAGSRVVGSALGGIVGGLLGHQFGKGRGKTAMTILGATGGAAFGSNAVTTNSTAYWYVHVQFDDGNYQRFRFYNDPGVRVGQRVVMQGNQLYRL